MMRIWSKYSIYVCLTVIFGLLGVMDASAQRSNRPLVSKSQDRNERRIPSISDRDRHSPVGIWIGRYPDKEPDRRYPPRVSFNIHRDRRRPPRRIPVFINPGRRWPSRRISDHIRLAFYIGSHRSTPSRSYYYYDDDHRYYDYRYTYYGRNTGYDGNTGRGYDYYDESRRIPRVVDTVACEQVIDGHPRGFPLRNEAGLAWWPEQVCRYIVLDDVVGTHEIYMVAYLNNRYYSTTTTYRFRNSDRVWFCERREQGHWHEDIYIDGMRVGSMRYDVGIGSDVRY